MPAEILTIDRGGSQFLCTGMAPLLPLPAEVRATVHFVSGDKAENFGCTRSKWTGSDTGRAIFWIGSGLGVCLMYPLVMSK